MKYLFIVICSTLIATSLHAQNSWCVRFQGKQKLRNATENLDKNRIEIENSALNKPGYFRIDFNRYDTAVKRSILMDDASDGLILLQEIKKTFRIHTKTLRSLIKNSKEVSFYYSEIPRDIENAMAVRVRLIHLCTLIITTK